MQLIHMPLRICSQRRVFSHTFCAECHLIEKKSTAVDKAVSFKLEDARDALINKCVDILGVYRSGVLGVGNGPVTQMPICDNMKLFPLIILGILKNVLSCSATSFRCSCLTLRLLSVQRTKFLLICALSICHT
jgi:hypothetical protein